MRINANSHASSRLLCIWEQDLYPLPPLSSASDRPWQSPPEAPDDRLTNVQGLLLDPVNSLRDTAATVRPGRVVHHSFSVDGETSPHCRP